MEPCRYTASPSPAIPAGRVVRTPTDRGSVHLIDDRFGRPEVRALLPAWWRVELLAGSPRLPRDG